MRVRPFLIFHFKFSQSALFRVLVAQSCPTLCNPMDCSSPGSLVHGILQARILEWVAIPFSMTCLLFILSWDMLSYPTYNKYICFCSVTKPCPAFWDHIDSNIPGFPVLQSLPEFAQIHVHWVGDAIQPSHPLLPPSPCAISLHQHHGLFQLVGSYCQVAEVLELQLQPQSFQWLFRVDFL